MSPRETPAAGVTIELAVTATVSAAPAPAQSAAAEVGQPFLAGKSILWSAAVLFILSCEGLRKFPANPNLLLVLPHQGQKLIARLLVFPERSQHRAGHRLPMLLLHPAHLHAQVPRLNDHSDSLRRDFVLESARDLAGHALLNLQSPRVHVHQPRHLAQANHLLARQIRHVRLAKKRQQVMLAQTEKFDVLHHHHLVVPAGQKLQCLLIPFRSLLQAFALRILPNERYDLPHQRRHALRLHAFFIFVEQKLFRWFDHDRFPFWFPSYPKLLFAVSCTRTRSSFARGKLFNRSKISMHKFSVVGTTSRNAATSSFSE